MLKHLCTNKMSEIHQVILNKRISELCKGDEEMQVKMLEAVHYAAQYSVYYRVTFPEFNTAMCIILGFFYSLIKGDTELSKFLMSHVPSFPHLRSSWLKVWLRDDFNFEEEDVSEALTLITVIINNGLLNVPMHIFDIFNSLSTKYEALELSIKNKASRTV